MYLEKFNFYLWKRKWQPIPVFLPGNPMDSGAWWAIVHMVAKESGTTWRLKNDNFLFLLYSISLLKKRSKMVHYFFKIHEQPAVEDDGNGENVG